jgi:hypothetical protein
MYRLTSIFIALVAACLSLGSGFALGGDESLQPSGNVPVQRDSAGSWSDGRPEAPSDIREDVRRAQEFLNHKRSGYTVTVERRTVLVKSRHGRTREKVVSKKVIEPAFLLAVEDLKEKNLRPVRFTSRGCETDGFDVIMTRNNGVGSRFEVRYPENMVVLALRTMVHSGKKGYKEVVYTPYCPEIDTRQVREDGLNYLKQQIESARMDLAERGVKLKGFEGLPVDVAPADVSLVLSIIEHIDPCRFKNARVGDETKLVHEVLTIIGANTVNAYAYAKSPAGARGLFQFIPGTYEKILRKYCGAGLNKNFVSGCSSHVNAAKASLLLFDSDLNNLPDNYFRAMGGDVGAVGRYLAAAYNSGSERVKRSLRGCTNGWTCLLPEETKIYLQKFDAVWSMRKSLDM